MIGISSKTVYAVAALHELATMKQGEVLKIKEIATRASLPQNFLEQILLELRKQGILMSVKGAHGGYALLKRLEDVTLKEIIIILESGALSDICKTGNPALKLFWDDVRAGVIDAFDIPLSELKHYQQLSSEALHYSI